jgi:hypothetical protein
MKNILVLLFSLLNLYIYCQTYGNEWINYNQKYYTFKIVQEGVYKIDYETLMANEIDPTQFTSKNIQIFGRNKEQPIYVYDGGDNQINPGDFFIFYAQKNDGWLDSSLFRNPKDMGNPGQCLFSDTIHYFFTWNNSENNLRFVYESYENHSLYPPSEYCLDYQILSPLGFLNPGRVSFIDPSSVFDPGEGYSLGDFQGVPNGFSYNYTFEVNNLFTGNGSVVAPSCNFQFKGSSLNNAASSVFNNHHTRLSFGNTVFKDTAYRGYHHLVFDTLISPIFLSNNNTFKFEIVDDLGVLTDRQSINYLSIKYPRVFKLNWANFEKFEILNQPTGKIKMHITNSAISKPM